MTIIDEENRPIIKKKPEAAESSDEKNQSLWSLSSGKRFLLVMMFFGNVFVFSGYSLLSPFFPNEAAKKGTSPGLVGLIISSYEFVMFLTAPLFGKYIATLGFRFMYVTGVFVCAFCTALFGILAYGPSGIIFIVMCLLTRSLEAIGSSAFITACLTLGTISFPDNVALVAGYLESAMSVGTLIGPTIGGILFQEGGYYLPFVTVGGAILVCGVVSCAFLPKPEKAIPGKAGSYTVLFRSKVVCLSTYVIICMGFSLSFFSPTLAQHLQQFNLNPLLIGLVFTACPVIYFLLGPITGRMADSGYHKPMMVTGCFLTFLGIHLIGPSPLLSTKPTLWITIVGLLVIGCGLAFSQSSSLKNIVEGARSIGIGADSNVYGLMSGVYTSAFAVGMFTGPLVGGFTVEHLGFQMSCLVLSIPVLISGILVTIYTASVSTCMCKCRSVCCDQHSSEDQEMIMLQAKP
ncbi:MFS-type transporter SLC18B1-like [Gigantopelta aegis]|uniref:MFS-type transporter SLC18B1-like n=1 Tax=Gigantopelta aegis TaxID=1735272 RepID=UPI001B88A9E1|nr:MFS-type transporter SLC18B1-like [Gigantopelta aegis]